MRTAKKQGTHRVGNAYEKGSSGIREPREWRERTRQSSLRAQARQGRGGACADRLDNALDVREARQNLLLLGAGPASVLEAVLDAPLATSPEKE